MESSGQGAPAKRATNRKRPKPTACFALLPEQVEQLRQIAEERGVSQSLLVREALDRYFRQIIQEAVDEMAQLRSRRIAEDPSLSHHRPMPVASGTDGGT